MQRIVSFIVLCFTVLILCSYGDFASAAAETSTAPSAFAIRAVDLPLSIKQSPGQTREQAYAQLFEEISEDQFNTVFLNLGNTVASYMGPLDMGGGRSDGTGYSKQEIARLIAMSRRQGLEPVLAVKMIGKMYPLLSGVNKRARKTPGGLVGEMPGLFRQLPNGSYSNTINLAYQSPQGQDVYDAVLFPLVDELLSLYGKTQPRYFLLGVDEFEVDELAESAKTLGISPSELFAQFLVRMTGYLDERGITPVIWGDMLLSTKLAKPGHGVKGFQADARFVKSNAYFSDYKTKSDVDLLHMINFLPVDTRSKIIVADWHYQLQPRGEYPSVDYLQEMGFQDVWGACWWRVENIRSFAQYAHQRGCGGMIMTTWGLTSNRPEADLAQTLLRNSGTWFIDPQYRPLVDHLTIEISDQKKHGGNVDLEKPICFPSETDQIHVRVPLPKGYVPSKATISIRPNLAEIYGERAKEFEARKHEISFELSYSSSDSSLQGEVTLPKTEVATTLYDLNLRVLSPDGRYEVQNLARQSVLVGDPLAVSDFDGFDETDSDWMRFEVPDVAQTSGLWQTAGQYPGLLYRRPVSSSHRDTAITYIRYPYELGKSIESQGMTLHVTLKAGPNIKGYRDIISLGNLKEGFRLIYNGDKRRISVQFANAGDEGSPLWLRDTKHPLGTQWTSVIVTLSPPDSKGNRYLKLKVGDANPVQAKMKHPLVMSSAPLVVGSEFSYMHPFDIYRAASRLNWNGLVGQVRLSPPSSK